MANRPLPDILHHLRRLTDPDGANPPSDAQLLQLFIGQHSEDAFTTIVRRHGPLVLRVCRQILADPYDAEDAFQATFLVLVRKAASIGRRELLAGWLYGVAHRIAVRVRYQSTRRHNRERPTADVIATEPSPEPGTRELWSVLHEEVVRLPAKYRQPVVLCYLEGKTLEEAGRLLGWPKGTVSGRLARARDLLHRRLTRRGVAVPAAGGVAALVGTGSASAALPGDLLRGTVLAALAFASGPPAAGVVSTSVISLAEGVLQSMFMTKLKILGVVLLLVVAGAVTAGAGFAVAGLRDDPVVANPKTPQAKQPEVPKPEKKADKPNANEPAFLKLNPIPDDPKDDELHKLMKERFNVALVEVKAMSEQTKIGTQMPDRFLEAASRVKRAGLELVDDPKEKIAILEMHVELVKDIERIFKERYDAGKISVADVKCTAYYRADAEIELLRLKGQKPAKP